MDWWTEVAKNSGVNDKHEGSVSFNDHQSFYIDDTALESVSFPLEYFWSSIKF